MPQNCLNHAELIDKYVIYSATDLKGIITEASQAFCDISGYSKAELLGQPHSIIRHPDMPHKEFQNMWETIQNGSVWEGSIKNRKKDGSGYWVHARVEPIYDEKQNVTGYFAVREEISDKISLNQTNKELFEQVNLTKAILDSSKSAIATITKEGYFIDANAYFKKKFHVLNDGDITQICLGQLVPQTQREQLRQEVKNALKNNGSFHAKRLDLLRNYKNANSKLVPCEIYLNLLPARETVVVVINFIGDKIKLKNSLKKSKTYFKKAAIGFLITDKDHTVIKVNPKLRQMLDFEKEEVKNRPLSILFESDKKYEVLLNSVLETLERSKLFNAVYLLKKKNGDDFWAEISATKFYDEEITKKENIFWAIRDITPVIKAKQIIEKQNKELLYLNENLKKEVEKQVKESIRKDKLHQEEQLKNAKYSAIGQLAAGITHEINTPLTYIKGNFEMMELDIDAIENEALKNDIKEQMQPIKEGLERIANIVENMREVSQKTKEEKIVTNIYATMVTALSVLQNRIKHTSQVFLNGQKFEMGRDKEAEAFYSYAQPQRLEQVWIVIISNALDELQNIEPYEARRLDITVSQDELNIYIVFKDNGGGIDESILDKVFDPFEKQKSANGIGIGLNIAKKIIVQQDGTIESFNEGDHAVFKVKLKRHKEG